MESEQSGRVAREEAAVPGEDQTFGHCIYSFTHSRFDSRPHGDTAGCCHFDIWDVAILTFDMLP
jgi:hypothetical protein